MAPYSTAAPPPHSARNAAVLRDGPQVTPSANAGAAIARAAHLLGDVMPACLHHSTFRLVVFHQCRSNFIRQAWPIHQTGALQGPTCMQPWPYRPHHSTSAMSWQPAPPLTQALLKQIVSVHAILCMNACCTRSLFLTQRPPSAPTSRPRPEGLGAVKYSTVVQAAAGRPPNVQVYSGLKFKQE